MIVKFELRNWMTFWLRLHFITSFWEQQHKITLTIGMDLPSKPVMAMVRFHHTHIKVIWMSFWIIYQTFPKKNNLNVVLNYLSDLPEKNKA